MGGVLLAGAAIFGKGDLFRGIGAVPLADVAEITADGAFESS